MPALVISFLLQAVHVVWSPLGISPVGQAWQKPSVEISFRLQGRHVVWSASGPSPERHAWQAPFLTISFVLHAMHMVCSCVCTVCDIQLREQAKNENLPKRSGNFWGVWAKEKTCESTFPM